MLTAAQVDECRAVDALLRVAARQGDVEGASLDEFRVVDPEEAEGLRLAEEHGVSAPRISAYRSLARSRGLDLEQVLRANFRGELREVDELPTVRG